jgi:hypothetical protein
MTVIQHVPWPKIARLNRNIVITEKIDGTNAAIGIVKADDLTDSNNGCLFVADDGQAYVIYAQSRKKLITPQDDNAGFAEWVYNNAFELTQVLGEGLHHGEWWGSGINRGYGLKNGEKRFSLFNTPRYGDPLKFNLEPLREIGLDAVPVLYEGLFSEVAIKDALYKLQMEGSQASLGYPNPEGIIVYHIAAGVPFKVTIVGDEKPKGSNEQG